jgi:phosphate uptake regulator
VLRRAFRLVNEAAESLLLGIRNQDMGLVESIEEYHDNINKFVNYCLRLLNKYGYPDVKKTSMYFHVIASLDKVVDVLKYNARAVLSYKKQFHKDTLLAWEGVNKSIKTFYDLFYNFDMASVDALSQNRDAVKNMVDKSAEKIPVRELILLTNMKQILELLLDLTEFRMGLEY